MAEAKLGVIGLGVMGRNLALNAEGRGFSVAVFNRSTERTKAFAAEHPARRIVPALGLPEFVAALVPPRKILLMVKAGPPTDTVLSELLPLLDRGDVVVDGGNAHDEDTERRLETARALGVHYLGAGISGGAEGALHGPSIMPGGSEEAYAIAGPVLETIAAQGPEGTCCAYLGPGSAGHYVKTVHNGIEYAIMQALAEAYDLMARGLGLPPDGIADVFDGWNRGELASYLVEITATILRTIDPGTGDPLVESILDAAAQKGTGKWSSQSALDLGSPAPTIAAAVFARILSSLKDERVAAERVLAGPPVRSGDLSIDDVHGATLLTMIGAFAQGFRQLRGASNERGYGLDLAEVARIWTAGCVIRAKLLGPIRSAFLESPELRFLILAEPFRSTWGEHQTGLRRAVVYAHRNGIPVPAMSSALEAFDAYRTGRLPANLIQAQRDFFGAHTYERVDRDGSFHTDWESQA
jgi:6-phosphogluconate dehydrogenase